MSEKNKGHIVLLMAPSGSGKNTVVQGLGDLRNEIYFAKTYTSRQPREGSIENPMYVFVTEGEFEEMIESGEFIEWANFSGNYYGTPKSEIIKTLHEGKIVLKEMELQGVQQIRKLVPEEDLTVVYIDAGDWSDLEKRIIARAPITDEELELRRQRYEIEVQFKPAADAVVSNQTGEIEVAQENFRNIIKELVYSLKN